MYIYRTIEPITKPSQYMYIHACLACSFSHSLSRSFPLPPPPPPSLSLPLPPSPFPSPSFSSPSPPLSPPLSQDLDSPERSLVKEGQCFLKNIKKLYQCILFNDQLVFAHGDSRQSRVELQLPLEGVWVEDLEDLDPQTST